MLKRTGAIVALTIATAIAGAWWLRSGMRSTDNVMALQVDTACDSAQRACRARGEDLEFELQLGPPVRTLEAFAIQVRALRGPLDANTRVVIQFQMRDMDMGINRYRLLRDADGVWRGRALLPVCGSGRNDWIAQVEIVAVKKQWTAELPFTVVRP